MSPAKPRRHPFAIFAILFAILIVAAAAVFTFLGPVQAKSVPAQPSGLIVAVGDGNDSRNFVAIGLKRIFSSQSVSQVTGLPDRPANLRVTKRQSTGGERATLRWDYPDLDDDPDVVRGDTSIEKYQYSADGGGVWTDIPGSNYGTTGYTIRGLTPQTEYHYMLRAVNPAGSGPAAEISFVTQHPLPERPGNLIATARDRKIDLSWDRSTDPNTTGYQYILYFAAPATGECETTTPPIRSYECWKDVPSSDGTTTEYSIDVPSNQRYGVALRAINPDGAWSDAKVILYVRPQTGFHRPQPPDYVAGGITDTGVRLQWRMGHEEWGSGSTITNIQYRVNGGDWTDMPDTRPDGATRKRREYLLPLDFASPSYVIELRSVTNIAPSFPSNRVTLGQRLNRVLILDRVLTVGEPTFTSSRRGFNWAEPYGSLDGGDRRFHFLGREYRLQYLTINRVRDGALDLLIGSTLASFQDGLTLELGELTFQGRDAIDRAALGNIDGITWLVWNQAGLDWQTGEEVPVSISVEAVVGMDYDSDDDRLIEINTLEQLHAMRFDPYGVGRRGSINPYWPQQQISDAFPDYIINMGCPDPGCYGYELASNLDFDTNGDGEITSEDKFWDRGKGWNPAWAPVRFEGNGRTISNLYINRPGRSRVGLFSSTHPQGEFIRNLGLLDVNVTGGGFLGGLVGAHESHGFGSIIAATYVTGSVTGTGDQVGGLVGRIQTGKILACYSAAEVTGRNYVGGLVGFSYGGVIAGSYAYGRVTTTGSDSYFKGGLTSKGGAEAAGYAAPGYWDAETSGIPSSSLFGAGIGKTTEELQAPTSYTGIYANWDVDIDGDGQGDAPWYMGTSTDYPALGPAVQTAPLVAPGIPGPRARVTISASNDDPNTSDPVVLTASVENPPEGEVTFEWARLVSSGWETLPETGVAATVVFDTSGPRIYRVTAIYPRGEVHTSDDIRITWVYRPLYVTISASNDAPSLGDSVVLTASVGNPLEGEPTFRWERRVWPQWEVASETGNTTTVASDTWGRRVYRATVIYPNGEEARSGEFSISWVGEQAYVTISANNDAPYAGEPVVLTANVEGGPEAQWWVIWEKRKLTSGWEMVRGASVVPSVTVEFDTPGLRTFRARVGFVGHDVEFQSEDFSVTWVGPPTIVTINSSNDAPYTEDPVVLTASVDNPPEGEATFRWERQSPNGWEVSSETSNAATVVFDTAGTWTYRVTAIYPGSEEHTSEEFSVVVVVRPRVTISTSNDAPYTEDPVVLTASVDNPPEGEATFRWERQSPNGWEVSSETSNAATVVFDTAGTWTYRVTAIYPGSEEHTSEEFSVVVVVRPRVTISTSNDVPSPGDRVVMTASVENPPEGEATFRWERQLSSGWRVVRGTETTKSVKFDTEGVRTYRVTAIYPGGEEHTSDEFSLNWR